MAELRADGDGAVAVEGGREVARLRARLTEDERVGPTAWLEPEGERSLWPDLYALAGEGWVRRGFLAHNVLVEADDAEQLELWFGLSFGKQQVYASQPLRPGDAPALPVRRGTIEDAVALGHLLPEHLHGPPVWSSMRPTPPDVLRREWEEFLADAGTAYFVAELDGRPAAYLALVHEDDRTTELAVAATLPEARGRGAMRALWSAACAWALEHGYERCDTDWRSTNLEAARCWTTLGFRPTRYRLHRLVGR